MDIELLKKSIGNEHDITLEGLGKRMGISKCTVYYCLIKLGYRYKKAYKYMEANEEKREEYIEKIKLISKDEIVYIDESGIYEQVGKDRGWGKKGKDLVGKRSGKYYQRTNIIAGYVNVNSTFCI